MMYEELVKQLRESKNEQCYIGCFGNCVNCKIDAELKQAADAIESVVQENSFLKLMQQQLTKDIPENELGIKAYNAIKMLKIKNF